MGTFAKEEIIVKRPKPPKTDTLSSGARSDAAGKAVSNIILLSLPAKEYNLLRPHLEPVDLPQYRIVEEPGQKIDYTYFLNEGMMSLVATGGGLLFGGDTEGKFRAFDQETGKILWEVNLGSPVTGYPITYSVNGRQHVAVSTGNSLVSSGLNALARELHPANASNVFVFALP